jgi:CRISPR-associated endonuclease Cas3-HD
MWTIVSPALRQLFTSSPRLPNEERFSWLAFVAGIHDIGKCTPEFQQKSQPLAAHRPGHPVVPHGLPGTSLLRAVFGERFAMPPTLALQWASVAGGHHGIFPDGQSVRSTTPENDPRPFGTEHWHKLCDYVLDQFIDLLRPIRSAKETLGCAPALSAAGLVSVADSIRF